MSGNPRNTRERIRRRVLRWTSRCTVAAAALAPAQAFAQASPEKETSADFSLARQLGNQGLELAAKGDCSGAIDPLKRSEAIHHAPTTLTVLGECHIAMGKLVDGVEELTRVVREELDPRAPPAFRAAQARARTRLEEARARVSKLRIVVDGVRDDELLTVRLDGQQIPAASLGVDRPVDPGSHQVEVTAPGYQAARGRATLKEGEGEILRLTLEPIPADRQPPPAADVPKATPKSAIAPVAPAPVDRGSHGSALPYIAFGVGGAGIITGSVFGLVTLSKTSSLDKTCPSRSDCPAGSQPAIDSAKTTALVSTIGFGVGVAGLVAGTYFALRSSQPERTASKTGARRSGPTVHPWVSIDSIGLDGWF
jgi:hypothetical protein